MYRIFPWVIFLFILLRFVLPLKVERGWKVVIAAVLLVVSQQRLINSIMYEAMPSSELPFGVVVLQGLMLSIVVLLTVFVILRDVLGLSFWMFSKKKPLSLFSSVPMAIGMCVIALLLSVIGVWQAVRVPGVKLHEIEINGFPPALNGFAIVQLTDIHATTVYSKEWVRAVVNKANALKPDIFVITGDIVDGSPEKRFADVAPLGDLRAKFGVYAVHGNHDYSHYEGWMDAFNKLDIRMLQNEHVLIVQGGSPLILAGVTDRAAARRGLPEPDIAAALSGAPDGIVKILMCHRPDSAWENARAGVDLQLSGHTHGGQIVGLNYIVRYANNGLVSGLYKIGEMQLYISNGVGLWNGFPIRIGCPSEITCLVLRSHSNS